MGFITTEDLEGLYDPLKDYVAVYIQQTFQVAGFTLLIPKDQVEIIDVKPEDAMKFILSGGMTSTTDKQKIHKNKNSCNGGPKVNNHHFMGN